MTRQPKTKWRWFFTLVPTSVLLVSCVSTPKTWTRADGQPQTSTQTTLDLTACQGEMQKSNLSSTMEPGIALTMNGPIEVRSNAMGQVFAGCMAARGYVGSP